MGTIWSLGYLLEVYSVTAEILFFFVFVFCFCFFFFLGGGGGGGGGQELNHISPGLPGRS